MPYELTHDTIARQVFNKASTEAQTRRKVERFIRERYQAFQDRKAPLTQEDIDYVWPYLNVVNSPSAEIDFLRQSKRKLLQKRRTRLALLTATSVAFAILAIWALGQRNRAEAREEQSQSMRISLAARYALYEGNPALAFRLAEQTIWDNDLDARAIAEEVIQEIRANPLVRTITHEDSISAMQFAYDGSFFMTASLDGSVRLSSLKGKTLHELSHESGVSWAQMLPQEKELISLTTNGSLLIWNIEAKQQTSLSKDLNITQASLSIDGKRLLGIAGKTVYVWNLSDPALSPLSYTHEEPLTTAYLNQQEDTWELITATQQGGLFRWDSKGVRIDTYRNVLEEVVHKISTSPEGDKVVFQTKRGDFMLAANGDSLGMQKALLFRAYQPTVSSFAAFAQPARMVSISRDNSLVYVWNMGDNQRALDMQWSPREEVLFATLSQDGQYLLASSTDHETVLIRPQGSETDKNPALFRFSNHTAWGVLAPVHTHFLSSAGGQEALLWQADSTYVQNKQAISDSTLVKYYQTRLRPLNAKEKALYKLD